jgi:hypothetical protein
MDTHSVHIKQEQTMNLDGNYIGRNGFLPGAFVKDALIALKGEPTSKDLLIRSAVMHGAEGIERKALVKKLSESLNTIANTTGFKRIKIKGKTGYFFLHIQGEINNDK